MQNRHKGLTDRQRNCYDVVKGFQRKNGYTPTVGELAESLNLTRAGTWQLIHVLSRKLLFKVEPNVERPIKVRKTGVEHEQA